MTPIFTPSRCRALRKSLLAWFAANARVLPWRVARTPYRIWISEIMLQQTRVDTVIPYYKKFVSRFPSVQRLARASRDEVLKAWEGLGYYSRARNLHAAAQMIVEKHAGRFPRDLESIRNLPGIGPYTAAAIGSIAFGIRAAAVDGNVVRVLARLTGFEGDLSRSANHIKVAKMAEELLDPKQPGAFNEALMELGATCCTPRNPDCPACPWGRWCAARELGRPEDFPRRKRAKRIPHREVGAGVVFRRDGRLLIAKRKPGEMLGGLWEFPGGTRECGETIEACIARELKEELDIEVAVGPRLATVYHAFSHFTMDLHAHTCRILKGTPRPVHCADWRWVSLSELDQFAFGRADQKIIETLHSLSPSELDRFRNSDF
ncbi:MAG: A/G-specific adenine glycosylase [Kiritimatiellae bacterium]|nr:A/G-specific adenine glycosylase [Kiritimatiellia bacterium]MDW8458833.1 A/G-specific adenine glycosylase [Verrucomicrobiota bacterium]